jgi:hypothetical protein
MAMPAPLTFAGRAVAGTVFGSLARLLGDRPIHPDGAAFTAELIVETPRLRRARLFAKPGRHDAFVRLSRGFGLPEPLPDLMSLAIKVPGAYGPGRDQDLLLTAAGDRPVLRHVFAWGGTHADRTYSTVLPFSVGGTTMLLGATPDEDATTFALRAATPLGPWHQIARVELRERLSQEEEDALAFNSDTTGGGIRPVGLVNRVRAAAYDAAAAGRS